MSVSIWLVYSARSLKVALISTRPNHLLSLFATDSIREMKRYSIGKEADSEHGHLDAELQHSMKLFRAQRNFYVAGFALFLYLYVSLHVPVLDFLLNAKTFNPKQVRFAALSLSR